MARTLSHDEGPFHCRTSDGGRQSTLSHASLDSAGCEVRQRNAREVATGSDDSWIIAVSVERDPSRKGWRAADLYLDDIPPAG